MSINVPFFDQLDQFSDHVALIAADRHVSYQALLRDADAFAVRLGARRRLVFLQAANTVEAIAAYIGCLRGGHVVHLFGEGDEARLPALLESYRPNVVIHHDDGGQRVESRHEDDLALHPDLAVLLSTSGSTGSPKFVKLSKTNITANAQSIIEYLALDHTERAITTLKFNYSYGLSIIHSHLACGASLVLTDASVTTPGFWPLFEAQGATSFAGVPYTFEMLQRSQEWAKIPGLRYVTQAGGWRRKSCAIWPNWDSRTTGAFLSCMARRKRRLAWPGCRPNRPSTIRIALVALCLAAGCRLLTTKATLSPIWTGLVN